MEVGVQEELGLIHFTKSINFPSKYYILCTPLHHFMFLAKQHWCYLYSFYNFHRYSTYCDVSNSEAEHFLKNVQVGARLKLIFFFQIMYPLKTV